MFAKRSFEVFENRTSKRIHKKSYATADDSYLRQLKSQQAKGEISIFCSCSSQIELKVSSTRYPYLYPATRGKKHGIDCCRHANFQGESEYEKAWNYNEETDEYTVRIETSLSEHKEQVEEVEKNKKQRVYRENPQSPKKGKVTIFGLATKLNMMAWEKIVMGNKERLPADREELSKHVYGIARNIRISNKKASLQSLFYDEFLKGKKISDLTVQKDNSFMYMEYIAEKGIRSETIGENEWHYITCRNSFGKEVAFYVDAEEWKEKLKIEPHSSIYIVAGFAYRASKYHHRKLTLSNYCLMPVSERGLFVESSYEKKMYDYLCKHEKNFIKPYLPIEEYGGYVPDFIVYEKESMAVGEEEKKKKPIIGEIFGIVGNKEYDERKEEKKAIARTEAFQSVYRFAYKDMSDERMN